MQDYEPLPDPDMPVGAEAVENTSQQQSGGLFDGNYDEAASAQLFQDALKVIYEMLICNCCDAQLRCA